MNFKDFVKENNIVKYSEKPFKLKSGKMSNWYVNWRVSDAKVLDELSDYLVEFLRDKKFDSLFGVPEGATKLAIITQYKLYKIGKIKNIVMGRGKIKEHGDPKDRFFLGKPEGKTIVLEDVITTGNSLLNTIDNLINNNVKVVAALVLTDRTENNFREKLEKRNVTLFALSKLQDLL